MDYSIGNVFAWFGAVLVVLHLVVFLAPKARSARLWKGLDYLWLGTAALGLLSGVSEAVEQFAERNENEARWVLDGEHRYALARAEADRNLFAEVYPLGDWLAAGDTATVEAFGVTATWYKRLGDSLSVGVESGSWTGFAERVPLGIEPGEHRMLDGVVSTSLTVQIRRVGTTVAAY